MSLIASNGSTERWCLAAVAVLLLAPVVVCGLWTMAAHVVGIQGEVPAAAVVFSGSVIALCGLLRGRYAIAAVVIASAMTAALVVSARWWVVLPLLLITGAASGLAFRRLVPHLPHSVDGMARRRRVVAGLWLLAAMVAVVQSNRMSVFMADPNAVGYSLMPGLEMVETHSCLTSYVHGASVAQAGLENPYDYDLTPPPETAIDFLIFDRGPLQLPAAVSVVAPADARAEPRLHGTPRALVRDQRLDDGGGVGLRRSLAEGKGRAARWCCSCLCSGSACPCSSPCKPVTSTSRRFSSPSVR